MNLEGTAQRLNYIRGDRILNSHGYTLRAGANASVLFLGR